MKLKVRKIGNSKGVLLPRKVVDCSSEGVIDLLVVKEDKLFDYDSRCSSMVERSKIKKVDCGA